MKTTAKSRASANWKRAAAGLLLTVFMSVPAQAGPGSTGTWQALPEGGFVYLNEEGTPVTGWIQEGEMWYYGGENGVLLTDTMTPDGYYVNGDGAWYRRSEKILGAAFQAPERFLIWEKDGFSWPGKYGFSVLSSTVKTAFSGERSLRIREDGLEYRRKDGTVLIGLYPDSSCGGWRLDLAVGLDKNSVDLAYADTYNYQIFKAFLYQISSAPETAAAAICDSWSGSNAWGLSRTAWTRVGDMQIRYGASDGMGHFWMIP